MMKPSLRPRVPMFSSGPCAKRPGWALSTLQDAVLGRSHRSKPAKAKIVDVIARSRALLGIPDDWHVGIVPASDTGAVEMAMWSLLGARPVDILVWESFGKDWATDAVKQLALNDCRVIEASYGEIVDFSAVDFDRDVVFTWNGTTSGICVPGAEAIPATHAGLAICDATSATFAMDLPWDRLDVVTWSWQKALGGEAGHGMLAISPRAVERLETYTPPRPLPKIFRLTKNGALNAGIFKGETINTPSLLSVEDALDGLKWADEIGGFEQLKARCQANLAAVGRWVDRSDWAGFLAADPSVRSPTSICLKIVDPWFDGLDDAAKASVPKAIATMLEDEGVAFDINGYRSAPPGLRIWGGATVETDDVEALLPWLDWAYAEVKGEFAKAA